MSNKRITDLTELTNPTTDDVFPVVDIATNTTTKVQLGNLPVPSSVTTALATKQDSLVSGTNIKTINSTSVLGSGNIAVQETLVSGTNIKTLNNTSLLGSGNITIAANPSGVAGAIQFSDGSAFASDASNLFWDDTNNRLGIGTNTPTQALDVVGSIAASSSVLVGGLMLQSNFLWGQSSGIRLRVDTPSLGGVAVNTTPQSNVTTLIRGWGSTSATTSLLVQNSAGTELFKVNDNGESTFLSTTSSTPLSSNAAGSGTIAFELLSSNIRRFRIFGTSALATFEASNTGGITTNAALNVGGSAAAQASAILQADSTTKGFLPPRMTTTQKNAIASPAAGLVVYDSTTNKLQCYNGSTWNDLF